MDPLRRTSLALALATLGLAGCGLAGCGLVLDLDAPDPDVRLDGGDMDAGRSDAGPQDGGATDAASVDASRDDAGGLECEVNDECPVAAVCWTGGCREGRCFAQPTVGAGCDDGVYCNGDDSCGDDGACSVHAGDPCSGVSRCDEDVATCVGCARDEDCPGERRGDWGPCAGAPGSSVCALTGTRARSIVEAHSCVLGTCVVGGTRIETEECPLLPGASSCAPDTMEVGACVPSTLCGGQQTITTRRFRCSDGSCVGSDSTATVSCSFDGAPCGTTGCTRCEFAETCDLRGMQTCTEMRCSGAECASTGTTSRVSCERSSADLPSECRCAPSDPSACNLVCLAGIACLGANPCGCRSSGICGCLSLLD